MYEIHQMLAQYTYTFYQNFKIPPTGSIPRPSTTFKHKDNQLSGHGIIVEKSLALHFCKQDKLYLKLYGKITEQRKILLRFYRHACISIHVENEKFYNIK